MKPLTTFLRIFFTVLLVMAVTPETNSQILKKLGKRAERAAERSVERKVAKETSKKTDEVLDSILTPGQKKESPGDKKGNPVPPGDPPNNSGGDGNTPTADEGGPKSITVYSKFDFVPGDKILFFDDFSKDFIGDFPSKWNTNGGGEVVTINDSPEKWLDLIPGYNIYYIPDVPALPEEYTIEFDMLTSGMDNKTSSNAALTVTLSDDAKFGGGQNFAYALLPVGQYGAFDIRMRNHVAGDGSEINSGVRADIRKAVLNRPHVSIAVNKQRYRLWVNETKYVDIPRMIPPGVNYTLKFNVNSIKDGKERIFITNLKVAEGGLDLRRTLISEGKVSTNGILFDSGSANIQPQSMGIIRQISQVLQQESGMSLNIVGHTDSDGDDAFNLDLSKKRADAVKNALVNVYSVSRDRLQTSGKGESEPVGDNGTPDGKAQNRRVEFIQIQ
ncbi:MAG TPA: OmpA family protein [Eudoraea sp.]|nr:OmpA family protein [Eudoraea sp.]